MTTEEKTRILNHLYSRLSNRRLRLENWITSVTSTIDNLYGNSSAEATQFKKLVLEYETSKPTFVGYSRIAYEANFKVKGKKYLHTLIQELNPNRRVVASNNETKYVNQKLTPTQINSPNKNDIPLPMNQTDKKHYTIGINLFWTVIIPLVAGIFYFGYFVGNTKFDKEKIDMSDQIRQLKLDTTQLRKEAIDLRDSVSKQNIDLEKVRKDNNDLLLYLGTLQKNK